MLVVLSNFYVQKGLLTHKKETRQTTMMGFLKREKTDGETVLERLAVTPKDFNKSMLVESPVEASADNKESATEFLVTKVDAYLPGPSLAAISVETKTVDNPVLSQEESEALIQEYFLKVRSTTTALVSLNVIVKGKMETNSHLSKRTSVHYLFERIKKAA